MALAGQIAIVTGASCGIGRGIALQLGEAGATVYVAGRKPEQSDAAVIDTLPKLEQVAKDITARGGKGIAAYVDHSNMDEVKEFFARVEREHNGQLGILVNNAYSAVKDKNVCVVSIWPGAVRTELVTTLLARDKEGFSGEHAKIFEEGETTEYPGKAVVALACDDRRMEKTGRILITADMGSEYGFKDIDGRDPPNMRSLSFLLAHGGYKQAASMVPLWVKLPGWLLWGATSRL